MTPTELKQLNEDFNRWFIELLHAQPSCLDRDVLREPAVKMVLRQSFIKWYGENFDEPK